MVRYLFMYDRNYSDPNVGSAFTVFMRRFRCRQSQFCKHLCPQRGRLWESRCSSIKQNKDHIKTPYIEDTIEVKW